MTAGGPPLRSQWIAGPTGPGPPDATSRSQLPTLPTGRFVGPVVFVAVAVTYLALAQLVVWLNDPINAGASLWPAAGLGVAALLLLPPRLWWWVLAAIAVAETGGGLAHGYPLVSVLGWALGNCAEPLVGATLFRRFGNRAGTLQPVRQLLLFLALAVVAAPLLGATIGTAATVVGFGGSPAAVWPKYFVGDALGVLIVAPALLTVRSFRVERSQRESVAFVVGSLLAAVVIFGNWAGSWTLTVAYLMVPFFTWAALRYGVHGTAWLSLAVTLIANWFTAVGDGPFSLAAGPADQSVTLLQMFLAITVSSALVLAVLVGELTGRDEVEDALRHLASHDPLTGLPNRAHLAGAIDSALMFGAGDPSRVALLVCDIDHLKAINDTLGHRAGDELITCIAERLRYSVRPADLVARIGGDEFVIVLKDVDRSIAVALCERIIAAVGEPVSLDGNKAATPSVSIGAAMGEVGASGESIFNGADAALYEAKKLGRGRSVHFDQQLRLQVRERLEIESELPAALAGGQTYCLFQPEVELATGALFGFESLARWEHPERGVMTADRFIPAVEATGNAGQLFEIVLTQTLVAQRRWATNLGFRPVVAVNLSPQQLADPHLAQKIGLALARAGAPPDGLWLELTETAVGAASGLSRLTELTDLGVHLALDDFGTGWSSLARLSRHPWEALKLDRSFIARLGVDPRAEHLVRAMIVMAHALGMRTVAEGVETPEQLRRLTDLGCDIVQGFLFSPPVSARQAVELVDATGRWTGYPTLLTNSDRAAG